MSNSLASYYPAGQRILEKKGLDYTEENYLEFFKNDFNNDVLKSIQRKNKPEIKRAIRRMELFETLFIVIVFFFGYFTLNLLNTLSYNVTIENGNIILTNQSDILIGVIICVIFFIVTWLFKSEISSYKKTFEAGNF